MAESLDTPLYVYDLDEVDRAASSLRSALPEGSRLYYSLKANPHPGISERLNARGCEAEVSSSGELACALDAGFASDRALYTGPAKTVGEIGRAIASGVRLFSAESENDLSRLSAVAVSAGTSVRCVLRINVPSDGGGPRMRMGGVSSQFGIGHEELMESSFDHRSYAGVDIVGLQYFQMSNVPEEQVVLDEIRRSLDSAVELRHRFRFPLELLDLGGGFAAPYATPGSASAYPNLRRALTDSIAEAFADGVDVGVVAFESGRGLVASCGTFYVRVIDVKVSRGRRYVVVDGGINALGGLSGLGRLLPLRAHLVGDARAESALPATVVGPLCTPADVLASGAPLPDVEPGDLLAVPNVGAYGLSASLLGFLSRPVATEVLLSAGVVTDVSRLSFHRNSEEGRP